MTRLMEAVPKDARVILLGDRDQLASVEPGSVFADLCLGANAFSRDVATALHHATGHAFESTPVKLLADASVLLSRSYRFDAQSGIGALSVAVRDGHAEAALELLDDSAREDIALIRMVDDADIESTLYETLLSRYRARIESIEAGEEPARIFSHYRAMQVLCALRKGAFGISGVNARIERMLSEQRLIDDADPWYPGRPIMITTNDYGLGLFNGDLGIVLPHRESGITRACFLGDGGKPLWVHPARLPEHETAWAMTVHKSQGSEFDHVVVILPQRDAPVLSRELLYTAISRARHRVDIHASEGVLAQTIRRRVERRGGLARSLANRSP
jgi:exodeoxyribonuclease V alpha subunit